MSRFASISILLLSFLMALYGSTSAQGVSVSYLVPQNGLLSAPVSPFSVRNIRVPLNDYSGLQTGGSLYVFPGLPMAGLPFQSDETLRGSTFGIITPIEAYIGFGSSQFNVIFSGGVFGIGFLNSRLDQGAWDRAFMHYQEWELANGQLEIQNKLGWGWLTGISFEIPVNRKFSISLGINYLNGSSLSSVAGSYIGFDDVLGVVTSQVDFDEAITELKGIELSIGVSF